jgi:hypothetical protein
MTTRANQKYDIQLQSLTMEACSSFSLDNVVSRVAPSEFDD